MHKSAFSTFWCVFLPNKTSGEDIQRYLIYFWLIKFGQLSQNITPRIIFDGRAMFWKFVRFWKLSKQLYGNWGGDTSKNVIRIIIFALFQSFFADDIPRDV